MSLLRRHTAWVWLAVLLFVVAALSVISSTSSASNAPLALDSASPNGALALRLWLERIGYSVQSQDSFGTPPDARTLLILEPQREPSASEIAALHQWTRSAGRLVIISDSAQRLLVAFGLAPAAASPAPIRVTQPLLLSPETTHLSARSGTVSRSRDQAGTAAATASGAVLTRREAGPGEVWELTAPGLLDNQHVAQAQNRRLVLNLVGVPGPVLVDQPGPGNAGGATDWLSGTAWGIAVIFGLAVVVLFRFLGGWRLGPPIVPFSERRRPMVEYVLSLAVLLRQAQQRADVLAVYQRELRDRLRHRFGTDLPDELPRDLAQTVRPLLERHSSLSEDALIEQAEAIVRCEEALKERV